MESETIPSEERKADSPFGAMLFKLPFNENRKFGTNVNESRIRIKSRA